MFKRTSTNPRSVPATQSKPFCELRNADAKARNPSAASQGSDNPVRAFYQLIEKGAVLFLFLILRLRIEVIVRLSVSDPAAADIGVDRSR